MGGFVHQTAHHSRQNPLGRCRAFARDLPPKLRGQAPFACPCCHSLPPLSSAKTGTRKKVVIVDARTHSRVARWAIRFADVLGLPCWAKHRSFDACDRLLPIQTGLATLWRGAATVSDSLAPTRPPGGLPWCHALAMVSLVLWQTARAPER